MLDQVREEARQAAEQICEVAKLQKGQILVVGCSTSEVAGHKVGSSSSPEIGKAIFDGLMEVLAPKGIYLAAQCCEHLNRALIVEGELAEREKIPVVNVVPQPKAGGSFGTAAYKRFAHPAAVEFITAQAGMDIGDTLIGMHLAAVAVPVRTQTRQIGSAHVVCARTRGKFIGGERAIYNKEML